RHVDSASQSVPLTIRPKPITDRANRMAYVVVMRADILTSDIGAEDLIAVRVAIQDKTRLGPLTRVAKSLGAQEYSQLEWHVEAGEPIPRIKRHSGQIMNSIVTLTDDLVELFEADLTTVILLPGPVGYEPGIVN